MTDDYNAYHRTSSTISTNLVKWTRKDLEPLWFAGLDQFRAGTAREANGIAVDDQTTIRSSSARRPEIST